MSKLDVIAGLDIGSATGRLRDRPADPQTGQLEALSGSRSVARRLKGGVVITLMKRPRGERICEKRKMSPRKW